MIGQLSICMQIMQFKKINSEIHEILTHELENLDQDNKI